MLQQRVKYMRITELSQRTIKPQNSIHTTNNAQIGSKNQLPALSQYKQKTGVKPVYYTPAFKGYVEDKEFISTAINMLDNAIDDVNSILYNTYETGINNDFLQALEGTKQNEELYEKITETPEIFDKIASSFNLFNSTTLKSLDEVRYDKKYYNPYWEKNSKIGNQKTSYIIKNAVNKNNDNINKIIKKSNDKDYAKIKSELISEWFETAYQAIKQQKPQTITQNFKELSQTVNEQYAKTFVLNEQTRLCSEFNQKTKERILASNTDSDKKQHAFALMLSYIQSKLLEDKGKDLDKDFDAINKAKNILQYAKEKESLFYARYAINLLHGMAFEKWEKDNLVPALNIKLQKEIFYNKEEKKNEELKRFQNYRNFDTDGKYFVSRYYDACCKENDKYNFDSKDYVWQIINNRHNPKPAHQAIKELSLAVKDKQDFYFEQLDSFYDLLQQRKYNPETKIPQRHVDTPNDKLSFADLYLEKLGKTNNFKRHSEEEKLDYLTNLTREEMLLLNKEIKRDWYKNDQKYSLLAQVNEQARNTSVFLEMYNELKKININLDEIKIKTNEISVSLKDALENRTVIAQQIQDDTTTKLSAQISRIQREYNMLDAEDKKIVDEKFAEIIPKIIKTLENNQTNDNLKEDLQQFSKMAKEKQPANHLLERTKSILLSHCILSGMTKGAGYLKNIDDILKAGKVTNNLSWANLGLNTTAEDSVFSDFFDIMPDVNPLDAVQMASTGIAAGGLAAKSGVLSSLGASLSNPVAAVVAVTLLVAGGGALVSYQKAKKLERAQRDLIFEVEI